MSVRSHLLTAALLASTAVATPLRLVARDHGPDGCQDYNGNSTYVAEVQYFTDDQCSDNVGYICYYAYQSTIDGGSGEWSCEPGLLPTEDTLYGMMVDTAFPSSEIYFTQDQSCPPSGPGAVFASLIDNNACVKFNHDGSTPGATVYPNGGSPIAKKIKKRDPNCSGFSITSQEPSESNSVQVSSIVDCTNSNDMGCSISEGEEYTQTVTSSFSLDVGGSVEGIDIGASFGEEYSESETSSITSGFTIDAGQKGYLSAYTAATLFKGMFTGCDSGDSEQPGESLVLKSNGFTYEIVYTGD